MRWFSIMLVWMASSALWVTQCHAAGDTWQLAYYARIARLIAAYSTSTARSDVKAISGIASLR
jgi:hypothetical protein